MPVMLFGAALRYSRGLAGFPWCHMLACNWACPAPCLAARLQLPPPAPRLHAAGAPTARATALGIGCGFGLGSAWQQNQASSWDLLVPATGVAVGGSSCPSAPVKSPLTPASMQPCFPSGTLPLAVWRGQEVTAAAPRVTASRRQRRRRKHSSSAVSSLACTGCGIDHCTGCTCVTGSDRQPCKGTGGGQSGLQG